MTAENESMCSVRRRFCRRAGQAASRFGKFAGTLIQWLSPSEKIPKPKSMRSASRKNYRSTNPCTQSFGSFTGRRRKLFYVKPKQSFIKDCILGGV
ncbi:hypothetical protein WJR50_14155 [Catalinimonas sp. 4WD22]|uniref:hypothetical protein n=1 Tax=Catalinimonas locisalis TaxID=3133978 RepID=UPI0031017777